MQLKRFKINSALLYVLGSFFVQGISLLTTPIFTRILTPADYGVLAIFTLWAAIFGSIIGLQSNGSIMNAKITYGIDSLNSYMSSVMTLATVSFVFFLSVSLLFRGFLSMVLNIDASLVPILFVQCFFGFCISFMSSKFVALEKPVKFFVISAANTILTVGLSILFVLLISHDKYLGKIYATLLVSVLIGGASLVVIYAKGKTFISIPYWKFCLPLTLPLIVHGLSNLLLNQADRYMLSVMTNETVTGIYSFAYTLGSIIFIIWLAINNAWVPWYYQKTKDGSKPEILETFKLYNFVFVIITIGFILISPEFVGLMGSQSFRYGIYITPLIAAGNFFIYLYSFPVNYEFYRRKTLFISIGTLCAALINIGLNLFLIPNYSSIGAAVATLVSYILLFLFHYIIAAFIIKDFQIPFRYLLLPAVIVLVATGLFYLVLGNPVVRWLLALSLLVYLTIRVRPYLKRRFRLLPNQVNNLGR